jgi:hypothetical protein
VPSPRPSPASPAPSSRAARGPTAGTRRCRGATPFCDGGFGGDQAVGQSNHAGQVVAAGDVVLTQQNAASQQAGIYTGPPERDPGPYEPPAAAPGCCDRDGCGDAACPPPEPACSTEHRLRVYEIAGSDACEPGSWGRGPSGRTYFCGLDCRYVEVACAAQEVCR